MTFNYATYLKKHEKETEAFTFAVNLARKAFTDKISPEILFYQQSDNYTSSAFPILTWFGMLHEMSICSEDEFSILVDHIYPNRNPEISIETDRQSRTIKIVFPDKATNSFWMIDEKLFSDLEAIAKVQL